MSTPGETNALKPRRVYMSPGKSADNWIDSETKTSIRESNKLKAKRLKKKTRSCQPN